MRQYISDIVAADGHPLPVRMRRSDGKHTDDTDGSEEIVVMPPRYSKRSLQKKYNRTHPLSALRIGINMLIDILRKDITFVRVSLRAIGLCDICFVLRDTFRTVSDRKLPEKAQMCREHLQAAETTQTCTVNP